MNGKTDHPDRILSETRNGDSCPFEDRSEPAHGHVSSPADRDNEALASEEQAKLTPGTVVEILKQGNRDFAGGALTVRNNTKRIREAALWQYPKAVILSCIDSRIPEEDVFHRGIGELFVVRIAGNYVNADVLGCLEFACKVSGAKLIVVLGHEHCGAIKSVIDHVQLGHVTAMLSNLQPAVARANETFRGEKNASNPEYVKEVCIRNIQHAVRGIRSGSDILKKMEDKGEIGIVGAIYHMKTGAVTFL